MLHNAFGLEKLLCTDLPLYEVLSQAYLKYAN